MPHALYAFSGSQHMKNIVIGSVHVTKVALEAHFYLSRIVVGNLIGIS